MSALTPAKPLEISPCTTTLAKNYTAIAGIRIFNRWIAHLHPATQFCRPILEVYELIATYKISTAIHQNIPANLDPLAQALTHPIQRYIWILPALLVYSCNAYSTLTDQEHTFGEESLRLTSILAAVPQIAHLIATAEESVDGTIESWFNQTDPQARQKTLFHAINMAVPTGLLLSGLSKTTHLQTTLLNLLKSLK